MPVVPYKSQLPVHDRFRFLALDAEGMDLPSDWSEFDSRNVLFLFAKISTGTCGYAGSLWRAFGANE